MAGFIFRIINIIFYKKINFRLPVIIDNKKKKIGTERVLVHLVFFLHIDKGGQLCYAPAYSKNSGRALSVTPVRPVRLSVHPSVRPYVPLSCPGHNSKTLWNIFMKIHRCIHHNKTMCHEQG